MEQVTPQRKKTSKQREICAASPTTFYSFLKKTPTFSWDELQVTSAYTEFVICKTVYTTVRSVLRRSLMFSSGARVSCTQNRTTGGSWESTRPGERSTEAEIGEGPSDLVLGQRRSPQNGPASAENIFSSARWVTLQNLKWEITQQAILGSSCSEIGALFTTLAGRCAGLDRNNCS